MSLQLFEGKPMRIAPHDPDRISEITRTDSASAPQHHVLGAELCRACARTRSIGGKEYMPLKYPTFFTKATHTINGPYDDIPFDASVSTHIDWEAELGVVIGRSGKNIPLDRWITFSDSCVSTT